MSRGNKNEKQLYYSPNAFKRFVEYKEPDYLQVAGLYYSTEHCKASEQYNHFLVRGADYAAKRLGWFREDGEPDEERAQCAIYRACQTKAPNGFRYMYSESNKGHELSDKNVSRIYMSGARWADLKRSSGQNPEKLTYTEEEFNEAVEKCREALSAYGVMAYTEKQLRSTVRSILNAQPDFLPSTIIQYCDYITGDELKYQRKRLPDNAVPTITCCGDLFYKFDKFRTFKNNPDRHFDPTTMLAY